MKRIKFHLLILVAGATMLLYSTQLSAQNPLSFKELGKIKTLSSNEIETSRWSVGGETLDRDYANYHEYKSYLGPSGAKRVRLQGGWAKCEKVKGVYDFTWLDEIVDDALSQGVSPWIQPSYGNPIYEGGGQAILAGGIPTSEEALKAWDNWVYALLSRYKDKVKEWEVWNEPDISKKMTAQEFAVFHVRTCEIIKKVQPEARIIALGLAGLGRTEYVTSIMDILKAENKLHFMDVLSYHGYSSRPEQTYPQIQKLREILNEYKPGIEMWQGENGAPSTPVGQSVGALSREDWSELTQAKWVLRRMMGDIGHDVDVVNVFTLADLWYEGGDHLVGYNSKGLLKARPDHSIERPKPSYFAYQHTATLFSEKIDRIKNAVIETNDNNLMVFAFSKKKTKGSALVFWFADAKPVDEYSAKPVRISASGVKMKKPVLVDLLTGKVYQVPKENMRTKGNKIELTDIPVSDYPLVLVESSWLKTE
jgi:polysaccharide biosynthesis protein PslG